jgi:hypothetical protein
MNEKAKIGSVKFGKFKKKSKMGSDFQHKSNRIFVGGLHPGVDEQLLINYFSQFGKILQATIKRGKKTGHSKGYGFVTCADLNTKRRIMALSHSLLGKHIDVNNPTSKKKSQKIKQQLYNRKIYIPNLPLSMTEISLEEYFEQFAPVTKAYLILDSLNSGSKSKIGYVEFESKEAREKVLEYGGQHRIGAIELLCERYFPKGWKPEFPTKNLRKDKGNSTFGRKIEGGVSYSAHYFQEQNFGFFEDVEGDFCEMENQDFGEIQNSEAAHTIRMKNSISDADVKAMRRFPSFKQEVEIRLRTGREEFNSLECDLWTGERVMKFDLNNYRLKVALDWLEVKKFKKFRQNANRVLKTRNNINIKDF